jgi:hypothetical protein
LNAVFLEWIERLQKCVQVDDEYVGWTKRTQYIEIDFDCEIRLCCTWRGTPYTSSSFITDLSLNLMFSTRVHPLIPLTMVTFLWSQRLAEVMTFFLELCLEGTASSAALPATTRTIAGRDGEEEAEMGGLNQGEPRGARDNPDVPHNQGQHGGHSAGAGGASRGRGRWRTAMTRTCSLNRVFGTSERNFSPPMAPKQNIWDGERCY